MKWNSERHSRRAHPSSASTIVISKRSTSMFKLQSGSLGSSRRTVSSSWKAGSTAEKILSCCSRRVLTHFSSENILSPHPIRPLHCEVCCDTRQGLRHYG